MAKAATKKTSTTKKTTSKSATPSKAPTKTASKPKSYAVASTQPLQAETVNVAKLVKRKEFLERVLERTDMKPKDVKPVMDATLAVLGQLISEGEELNIKPLGRVKVNRQKKNPSATISILKVRQRNELEAAE